MAWNLTTWFWIFNRYYTYHLVSLIFWVCLQLSLSSHRLLNVSLPRGYQRITDLSSTAGLPKKSENCTKRHRFQSLKKLQDLINKKVLLRDSKRRTVRGVVSPPVSRSGGGWGGEGGYPSQNCSQGEGEGRGTEGGGGRVSQSGPKPGRREGRGGMKERKRSEGEEAYPSQACRWGKGREGVSLGPVQGWLPSLPWWTNKLKTLPFLVLRTRTVMNRKRLWFIAQFKKMISNNISTY